MAEPTLSRYAEGPVGLPPNPVIPHEIALEIDNFEAEVARFQRGELSPERFRSFRLSHGVYGQRQPGVQMIRVKIPAGHLDGRQIKRLADIADAFSPTGLAHLTTRQDVQFHYVPMERVPHLLRLLAEVGLTTREACGNSVRNVTACPLTGYIADELFDVQPYARAAYAFLVRNPFSQQLARKFKIAFSSCPEDCASTAIHDIGLVGRIRDEGGREQYGFKVLVGGGLGSTPFTAEVLEEFVPVDRLLSVLKGIVDVFSDHGNRRNKTRARLKFVVHKQGIDTFRRHVQESIARMTPEEIEETNLLRYIPDSGAAAVRDHFKGAAIRREIDSSPVATDPTPGLGATRIDHKPTEPRQDRSAEGKRTVTADIPGAERLAEAFQTLRSKTVWGFAAQGMNKNSCGGDALAGASTQGFERWASRNVRNHKDPSRAVVTIVFPLGDLEAPRLRALARLVTAYGSDRARIAISQNLVLPDVDRAHLRDLYGALVHENLAEASAGTAVDVTSCPGADTCAIGITSSKGLARAIRSELLPMAENGGSDALKGVTIKISGCPNSCGQHHVANIGFHGVVKKVGDKQIPAYQLHLGGRTGAGEAKIGEAVDKIPARNVPRAVTALLTLFREGRQGEETFADFAARSSKQDIARVLRPLAEQIDETDAVVDWGQDAPFTTDDMGTGECAGAGLDAVTAPFDNVEAELLQARLFMEKDQWVDALANLNRTQYTLARVLLDRLGKHPDSDYETTCELRSQVIDRGHSSELWNELHAQIEEALRLREPDPGAVTALHGRTLDLLAESLGTLAALERAKTSTSTEMPG